QEVKIRQAEADLNAKAARATFAAEDAIRYRNLAATGYGTRQNAERTSSADQEAQAVIKSSEASLAAARQGLRGLNADIAPPRAGVAQAKADLETAQLNLGYIEIRSSIDRPIWHPAAQGRAHVP